MGKSRVVTVALATIRVRIRDRPWFRFSSIAVTARTVRRALSSAASTLIGAESRAVASLGRAPARWDAAGSSPARLTTITGGNGQDEPGSDPDLVAPP